MTLITITDIVTYSNVNSKRLYIENDPEAETKLLHIWCMVTVYRRQYDMIRKIYMRPKDKLIIPPPTRSVSGGILFYNKSFFFLYFFFSFAAESLRSLDR